MLTMRWWLVLCTLLVVHGMHNGGQFGSGQYIVRPGGGGGGGPMDVSPGVVVVTCALCFHPLRYLLSLFTGDRLLDCGHNNYHPNCLADYIQSYGDTQCVQCSQPIAPALVQAVMPYRTHSPVYAMYPLRDAFGPGPSVSNTSQVHTCVCVCSCVFRLCSCSDY